MKDQNYFQVIGLCSAEANDLADKQPDKVREMLKALGVWRKSVQDSYAGKDYLTSNPSN